MSRGWEKGSESSGKVITSILTKLSKEGKSNHRNAFLAFLSAISGVEVDIVTTDGRTFRGIFHTANPFPNQKYKLALKVCYKYNISTY